MRLLQLNHAVETLDLEVGVAVFDGGGSTIAGDRGAPIPIPGVGDAATNFVHTGAATNSGSRYYRIRIGP